MKVHHEKSGYKYVPWYPSDDAFFDPEEGEEDNFVSYISRGLHRPPGGEVPFPGSSWTYRNEEHSLEHSPKSDAGLYASVLDALYGHKEVDASKIIVTVINGTVHLSGEVLSQKAASAAEEAAKSVPHVWSVQNHLRVEIERKNSH